jgi:gliding motility-associated-like protein
LKKIPPGYKFSARLGDEIITGDPNPRCWEQSLRYTMTVDSTNALLIMKFALVLQYIADHHTIEEPRFRVTLFNQKGDTLPDCANYDVYSSSGNVKGFRTYVPPAGARVTPIEWRDWTTVGANLLKYLGQTITIEFMAADCTKKFHYGYAYFVASCHPLYITVKYCVGDSIANLAAPDGFEEYSWTDSKGVVVDVARTLKVTNPVEGAIYHCKMTSATGCTVQLQSTIAKYLIKTDFTSKMTDCKVNTVQFTNLSSAIHGSLNYLWNFMDGHTSTDVNPKYTFATSGMHDISLTISNPPSTCVEKIARKIESFSAPLVGVSGFLTYCPGQNTYLKAHGANSYLWSNGSKADSIKVSHPGGKFWLLGRSSTGCVTDTIYKKVIEEPFWELKSQGDTSICDGKPAVLMVSGAIDYLWNTGGKKDSIYVYKPGIFTVTGVNVRGCLKSRIFNVKAYGVPRVDFTLSPTFLDIRHYQLVCSLSPQPEVTYVWDMGDGSTVTGPTIQHSYTISRDVSDYPIKLTATSKYGCSNSSYQTIEVLPFIPNVFSPNGDGLNDVFMPQTALQILNRNGVLLFKGNAGWDGTYNGRPVDPDTYFYLIDYIDKNQKVQTRKGYITLVR